MKPEYIPIPLVRDESRKHFEIKVNGYTAFIEYKERPGTVYLVHTEAPPELEGKGAATALIEKTLEYLEQHHLKLVPLCPLVFAYIKRHPEWKRIVDPGFTGFDR